MDAGVVTVLARVWTGARAADLEDVTLDFKTIGRSIGDALKDLAEAAMCFANAQGGTIVVGIQDGVGGRRPSWAPHWTRPEPSAGSTS